MKVTPSARRTPAALTLAELILALGLLSIILVLTIGLFLTLMNASSKSTNQSVGAYFAKQILEAQTARVMAGMSIAASTTQGVYCMSTGQMANFFYNTQVSSISGGAYSGAAYHGGYYIQVQTYWWDGQLSQARQGQGLQYTSTGRFVYPGTNVP